MKPEVSMIFKTRFRIAAMLLFFTAFGCTIRAGQDDKAVADDEGTRIDRIAALTGKANSSKARLLSLCNSGNYNFSKELKHAYLEYAKAKARADMAAMNRTVPDDFLEWIDSDPEMEASVYGDRDTSANIIMMLYSLRLDLGKKDFENYRQIALAHAIVHENQGSKANLLPRDPLNLLIPESPFIPVNTKDASRKLDQNDHIINFLNDHFVEEKIKEKIVKRPLVASDVLASRDLQIQFNAYMKQNGHDLNIDCGNRVIHPKSKKSKKRPRFALTSPWRGVWRNGRTLHDHIQFARHSGEHGQTAGACRTRLFPEAQRQGL